MPVQSYLPIGLQKTTESLMISLPQNGILFNHESQEEEKLLLQEK